MFAYSNNGLSFRAVDPDYTPGAGEVLFDHIATVDELTAAFPGYAQAAYAKNVAAELSDALNGTIDLTAASTPSLNGEYSVNSNSLANLNGVFSYTVARNIFPSGGTTFIWYDVSNNAHQFPSVAVFQAFAEAICSYIAAVQQWAFSGGIGSIPSKNITI